MDPAGPGFQYASEEKKLNSNDAQYVQCIYTDRMYGTKTAHGDGHGNFFMNSKGDHQPGCDLNMCDHSRAHEFFLASMNKKNIFEGAECRVENNQHRKDRIGIHSKKENGTFCVDTTPESPFAMGLISK